MCLHVLIDNIGSIFSAPFHLHLFVCLLVLNSISSFSSSSKYHSQQEIYKLSGLQPIFFWLPCARRLCWLCKGLGSWAEERSYCFSASSGAFSCSSCQLWDTEEYVVVLVTFGRTAAVAWSQQQQQWPCLQNICFHL